MTEKWRSPFTEEQADALNDWQSRVWRHPYTCGNDHDGHRDLIAQPGAGWVCPSCTYTQDWAHAIEQPVPHPE